METSREVAPAELYDRSKQHQVQSWKYRASSCLSTNFCHNIEQILCSSKKLVPKGEYTSVYSAAERPQLHPFVCLFIPLGFGLHRAPQTHQL